MKPIKTILSAIIAIALNTTLSAQETTLKADKLSFEAFELKLKQAGTRAQLIDVRTPEEFKLNHLKGSQNLDLRDSVAVKEAIAKLDPQQPVFVYSINNGRSGVFVKQLKEANFQNAYELPGGISKWIGQGRPVESITEKGLTKEEYKKLISSDKLVLVEIGSKFCGGCVKLVPVVNLVNKENPDKLKVVNIELFDNKQLGKELDIQSIPTLILYKGNKIVWQKNGAITKADIEAAIHQEYANN
ncbi:MAG TPA: thioredoxin domain-containing protein [Bacteroidia bacterium]|jgi:rhodanese-related sulfurtransferase|nr:thioredoxin domain-containing protein [Bacteroidia bacterium]